MPRRRILIALGALLATLPWLRDGARTEPVVAVERSTPPRAVPPPPSEPALETRRVPLVTRNEGRIEGCVTDPAGAALRLPVTLRAVSTGAVPSGRAVLVAPPHADGQHEFGGLAPGLWEVSCSAPGFRDAHETLELSREHPAAWFHLVLAPTRALTARLVDEHGEPLVRAILRADLGAPHLPEVRATLGDETIVLRPDPLWVTWTGEGLSTGAWTARAVAGDLELGLASAGPGVDEIDLVLPLESLVAARARLSLAIRREDGSAPRAPRAWLERDHGPPVELALDGSGGIDRALVPPGAATLWVEDPGCERLARPLDLAAAGSISLGPLRLAPGFELAGRTVDTRGRPCSATVRCLLAESAESAPRSTRSDVNGRFRLTGLRAGAWRLAAGSGAEVPVLVPAETAPIVIAGP